MRSALCRRHGGFRSASPNENTGIAGVVGRKPLCSRNRPKSLTAGSRFKVMTSGAATPSRPAARWGGGFSCRSMRLGDALGGPEQFQEKRDAIFHRELRQTKRQGIPGKARSGFRSGAASKQKSESVFAIRKKRKRSTRLRPCWFTHLFGQAGMFVRAQPLPRIALRSTLPSVAPKRMDLRALSMAALAVCTASSFLPA